MPTVTRFLARIGFFGLAVFAVMLALAYLVTPPQRPMSEPIDAAVFETLRPSDLPAAAAAARDDAGDLPRPPG